MISYWTGKKLSKEHIKKMSDSHKGQIPWNKGLKCPGVRERQLKENNPNWKGAKAGYSAIHKWRVRNLGKAKNCVVCSGKRSSCFEWANISGSYKREESDWVELCKSCHLKFDVYHSLTGEELGKIYGGERSEEGSY